MQEEGREKGEGGVKEEGGGGGGGEAEEETLWFMVSIDIIFFKMIYCTFLF